MRQSNSATRFTATSAKILLFALTIGAFQLAISSGPATAATALVAPTSLSLSSVGQTSATIAFASDTSTATSFTASVYTNVGLTTLLETQTVSAASLASTIAMSVTGLSPGITYYTTITAIGDGTTYSDSAPSSALPITTLPTVVTNTAILGVTAPVAGATPVTTITADPQFTGTVTWSPTVSTTFPGTTIETATITLTPATGYTLSGVAANFFTVAGANPVTNAANSGVITAVFPATGTAPNIVATTHAISGLTVPVTGNQRDTTITSNAQFTGVSVSWSPTMNSNSTYAASTVYTATIKLTAVNPYIFTGLASNFFTVSGANPVTTVVDSATAATVTAVFPATGTTGSGGGNNNGGGGGGGGGGTPAPTLSSDASLAMFLVNGASVLNSSTVTKLPNGTTSVSVVAVPTNAKANVIISGGNALVAGSNMITVRVIAEDGITSATYSASVFVAASSNSSLSVFTINGNNALASSAPITLSAGTTSLTVVATAADSTSKITINAPSNPVVPGDYRVIAIVVAADGTTQIYNAQVTIPTGSPTPAPTPSPTATPTPTLAPVVPVVQIQASILKNPYVSIATLKTKKKNVMLLGANTKVPSVVKGTALTFKITGNKAGAFLMIRVQTPINTFYSVSAIKTDSDIVIAPALTFAKAGTYNLRLRMGTLVKLVTVTVK